MIDNVRIEVTVKVTKRNANGYSIDTVTEHSFVDGGTFADLKSIRYRTEDLVSTVVDLSVDDILHFDCGSEVV